jgi:thymidine kinase
MTEPDARLPQSQPNHKPRRSPARRPGPASPPRLEVICGCMFSGKSEELIRRLARADIARQRVVAVKPAIDERYELTAIASHGGRRWPCVAVSSADEVLRVASQHEPDVLGIEEAQFFDDRIVEVARELVGWGVRVVCAGLDLDALGRPFGPMPALVCEAERVTKLHAVCVVCGEDASRSQLLVDGEPVPWQDGPLIEVGGAEAYEARCRACFEVPR